MTLADNSAMATPWEVSMLAMATGMVLAFNPVKFSAYMNSFQETIKLYTAVAIIPGIARGNTT